MRFSRWTVKALAVLALSYTMTPFSSGGLLVRAQEDIEVEQEEAAPYVPPEGSEKFAYEAEVHKMLDIVVNSLYQNKDVFLRELISNASDALDKYKFLKLSQPKVYKDKNSDDLELEVKIEYDQDARTLTIRDTGIGMTKKEMVENLGTVARSGTSKFMEALQDSKENISQIGQFGVGFYSAFLVADRVSVASKNPTDPVQHVWESTNGSSEFVVFDDPRGNSLGRGTEITLHLREDSTEYTDSYKLKDLAKHYSEFVVHPISLRTTETVEVEVEDEEEDEFSEEKKSEDDEDELEVGEETDEEADDEEEEKPKKTKEVTTHSWDLLNGNQAIWTRDKDEISDDEYQAFWQVLSGDSTNATTWSHFNAEGNINFKSILYLPDDIPASYRYGNMDSVQNAMRLYVRKVLIGDSFELLPKYLGFIRGVVDSDDLPLNVNRETLQESKILKVIQKKVVRKAIDMIRQLAKDSEPKSAEDDEAEAEIDADGNVVTKDKEEDVEEEDQDDNKYIQFYKKFSPNIKLGIMEDQPNQGKLVKLLRFETSKSDGKLISLAAYAQNMKDWQKDIYVLGCVNAEECASSPFLEGFNEKDVEVVFLTDAIDEYMVKNVRNFDGHKLVQISSENVKLNDEDEDLIKRRDKVYQKQFKPLTKYLKKLYAGTVMRVQVAKRSLGSVPAIVTSSEYGNSANMERILKAQAFQHGVDPSSMMSMKVFEINPRHPLVVKLLESIPEEDEDSDEKKEPTQETKDAAWMLHDIAMLGGGFQISDPEAHAKRTLKVLKSQFELESLALEPEINPPEEEDEPEDAEGAGGLNMDDFNMGDLDGIDLDALKAQMGGDDIDLD